MKRSKNLRLRLCLAVFFTILMSFKAFSQEDETLEPGSVINTEFYDQVNAIFARLELSRVPYGLLKDFALEQTDLGNYDGSYLVDSNKVNLSSFNSIYQTLQSAKVNSTGYGFTPLSTLGQWNLNRRSPGKIVLSGLFFKYSQFKENAIQNGQISILNNQVYDVYNGGTWQNPYDIKNAFAVSTSSNYYQGKTQQFLLPNELWLSNNLGSISSITFDAGDGQGFRTLTPNQPVSVNYATTGDKALIFKITLSDQTVLQSHSNIFIAPSVRDNSSLEIIPITATEPFQGLFANGTMTIQYANRALGLRNPVIIAEGFDTGHLINPDKEFGDNDYNGFLDMVKNPQNSGELNTLLYGPTSEYDIVYVDWKIGTDDIHRNALLFKEVIRRVNAMKAQSGSISKNIIIGQSMGGLITRWALKDMENKGENHQTRLFVSFDTPHQGANVPLGYQDMAIHLRKQYIRSGVGLALELISLFSGNVTLNDQLQLAKTPAAKQMLINYVNPNYEIDNSVHNAWQAELRSMGYPQGFAGSPIRNIAVSNGSECGKMLSAAPPGSELTSIDASSNTRFLTDLIGTFFPLWSILPIATGKPAFLLEIFPGKSSITADVKVRAIAEGGGNQVYYNKVTYKKKILWLIPVSATLMHQANDAPAGILAYDSYPGGYFDTQFSPKPEIAEQNWFVKYQISIRHQPQFSFVPAASALDIGSGATTLTDGDYKTMYRGAIPPTGTKASPFANFITAAGNNEAHTAISSLNGKWLAAEIAGSNPVAPDCAIQCVSNNALQGPDEICVSGTYQLTNLPSGTTIEWITTGNLGITGANNGLSVNITRTAEAGQGELLARLSSATCPNKMTLTKPVKIKSIDNIELIGNGVDNAGHFDYHNSYQFMVKDTKADWTYKWKITSYSGQKCLYTQPVNATGPWVIVGAGCQDNASWSHFDVDVTITDACGSVGHGFFENESNTPGSLSKLSSLKVFPNPANTELSVMFKPESPASDLPIEMADSKVLTTAQKSTASADESKQAKEQTTSVTLYNQKSVAVASGKMDSDRIVLDTRNIPNGTYFLHIKKGKDIEKRQIIIKH